MSPAIGLSDAFGSFAQELYTRYLNEVQLSKELQPGLIMRIEAGGVWVFRTVCFERVVLSSPGCLWPGRMDDHEEVFEAHA